MSLSAVSSVWVKEQIIALAMTGARPREIADRLSEHCNYQKVANTIAQARRDGKPIPKFGCGGATRPARTPFAAAPAPEQPEPKSHALDYFELRALKKLLGADLAEIEADADAEGVSVENYVREVLAAHVRKIRA